MKENKDILLGLSVACAVAEEGQTMTLRDLAEVCNCSPQSISRIEASIKEKIRRAVSNGRLDGYEF